MQSQITNWGDTLMTSLSGALAMFFAAGPRIIGFAVILIVGWYLASLIGKTVVSLLHAVRFDGFAERAGLSDFFRKVDKKNDASGVIAAIAKWFVRLLALVVAFDALGLPAVSDVLRQLLLWLPNLVVALVALVIGGIAANALSNTVRGAAAEGGLEKPDFLAKVAKTAVWAFAIVVVVNQIGIATAIVNELFMASVGAIALALGLSFGLGGRDTAGAIVRRWYGRGQEDSPQVEPSPEADTEMGGRSYVAAKGERRSGTTDRRAHQGPSIVR